MAARLWLATAMLLLFGSPARADDHSVHVWLNPGVFTHHFKDRDLREDNYGLGVEVEPSPEYALVAGSFINSNRERSHYAGLYWHPWEWKPAGISVRPGLVFALFDGYSEVNHGHWFPTVIPSVSAEYGIVGANLGLVVNPHHGSALALQFKLRVW